MPRAWRCRASTGAPRPTGSIPSSLKRAFLGWLRGERDHCKMAAIPTLAEEDAKRPHRERETLVGEQTRIINRMKAALARLGIRNFNPKLKKAPERLEHLRTPEGEPIPPNTLAELRRDMERRRLVAEQIRQIEKARLERLKQAPNDWTKSHGLPSGARDRDWHRDGGHAGAGGACHATCATDAPWRATRASRARPTKAESKRREKGLARSGNARVRRGMIQLAWRFLEFQKDSALAKWFRARTENARGSRKKMIVALARKLLIALWHFVRDGVVPEGVVLRPAH